MRAIPSFSVRTLLMAIALVALSITALRYANDLWTISIRLCFFVFLCSTIPGMVYSAGAQRAAWIGAAAFGWLSVVITTTDVLYPYLDDSLGTIGSFVFNEVVIDKHTPSLPEGAEVHIENTIPGPQVMVIVQSKPLPPRRVTLPPRLPRHADFVNVFSLLCLLLLTLIGSLISRFMYSSGQRPQPASPQS